MSSIQHKLLNCEVPPPQGTWDKIAAALEEPDNEKEPYATRLYELEVAPPAGTWQQIASSLDDETLQAPVKKIPFFRYAAAAVILFAIGITIFKLTSPGKVADVAINKETPTVKAPAADATVLTLPVITEDSPAKDKPAADYVNLDQVGRSNMKKALAQERYAAHTATQAVYAYEDHVPNLADRYVMLMTPEGSIIRMSKKLGSLICCVSGEDQDNDCKDQLKKWQEKMASSSLAPSPGNFLDILSLVNSLEDTEL